MDNNQTNTSIPQQNPSAQPDPYMQMAQTPVPNTQPVQVEAPNPYMQQPQVQAQAQSPYMQPPQAQAQAQSPYMQQPQAQAQAQSPYMQQPQAQAQDSYAQMAGYNQAPQTTAANTAAQNKNAKRLCLISLICYCAPYILYLIVFLIGTAREVISLTSLESTYSSITDSMIEPLFGVVYLSHIAGIVLMIVARAKYPKYIFAKVLMWVYIAFAIIAVLLIVALCLFLYYLCSTCPGY